MNPQIIKRPLITEKSLMLANTKNSYTFEVDRGANKNQIMQAIGAMYGVNVTMVRTIVNHAETKRTGKKRMPALQSKTKKAVVTLKDGEKIQLFETAGTEK